MTFIVQTPHSNTNPTNKYRVVLYADWSACCFGRTLTGAAVPADSEYDTFAEAEARRDALNNPAPVSATVD